MTEKDKKIQDQALEIEFLKKELELREVKEATMKEYIRFLEEMLKTDAEARDVSDFEG